MCVYDECLHDYLKSTLFWNYFFAPQQTPSRTLCSIIFDYSLLGKQCYIPKLHTSSEFTPLCNHHGSDDRILNPHWGAGESNSFRKKLPIVQKRLMSINDDHTELKMEKLCKIKCVYELGWRLDKQFKGWNPRILNFFFFAELWSSFVKKLQLFLWLYNIVISSS